MHGIVMNNKHSYHTFNAILSKRSVEYPSKKKITATVPYSNVIYDFSNLYGKALYSERNLKYTFAIIEYDLFKREYKIDRLIQWLNESKGKIELYDDKIKFYHFLAECTATSVNITGSIAKIVATFTAYPYKIPNNSNSDLIEVI